MEAEAGCKFVTPPTSVNTALQAVNDVVQATHDQARAYKQLHLLLSLDLPSFDIFNLEFHLSLSFVCFRSG